MTALAAYVPTPVSWRRGFQRGVVLAKRYRVEEVLGERDVTLVVSAMRIDLDQAVVLKILRPELAARELIASRFRRETKRAASLRSDHALRIFDAGRLASGEPFAATEWLDGTDVSAAGAEDAFTAVRAAELVAQACDAVGEAHERGWVHADLKPSMLLLAPRSRGTAIVKVTDFGMSTVHTEIDRLEGWLTPARVRRSEALYVAPEQLAPSQRVDARADVWALGAILYELLAGQAAFAASGLAGSIQLVESGMVPPPSTLRRGIPSAIEEVVMRCLEKDPKSRYADARELAAALDDAIAESSELLVLEPLSAVADGGDTITEVHSVSSEPHEGAPAPYPEATPIERIPTMHDETSTDVPSFVTGSDPSARALNVRTHPLAPTGFALGTARRARLALLVGAVVFAMLVAAWFALRAR